MLLLWDLYWPPLVAALVVGVIAGAISYRAGATRKRRLMAIAAGVVGALSVAALWHGPFGAAGRFESNVHSAARTTLENWEMTQVRAQLDDGMLDRTLLLSGPADDFQRGALVRIMGGIPGVSNARWSDAAGGFEPPLLAEVELWALVAFGLGLMLAYLVEMRRRARAEWRW